MDAHIYAKFCQYYLSISNGNEGQLVAVGVQLEGVGLEGKEAHLACGGRVAVGGECCTTVGEREATT